MLTSSTEKQRPTKRIEEVRIGAQASLKFSNNLETIQSFFNFFLTFFLFKAFCCGFPTFITWCFIFHFLRTKKSKD